MFGPRSYRIALAALITTGLPTIADAQTAIPFGDTIRIEPLVEGLNAELTGNTANTRKQMIPVDMTPLGDGRQLVLTLAGHVRLLQSDGTLASGAYLDVYNSMSPPIVGSAGGGIDDFRQIGNTSIAAHPDFLNASSLGYGKFYTITSEELAPTTDFDDGVSSVVASVVHEWSINPSKLNDASLSWTEGGAVGDTVTRRELLRSHRPGIIHTIVDMAFDNDGNLLITSGDGGGNAFANTDGSAFNQDRFVNSQDPRNIFGSILRIDPLIGAPANGRTTGGQNNQYYIPSDNFGVTDGDPDTPGETFAYGFRSPYRINIDKVTNKAYVGDVGEGVREEISQVNNGGNYGWGGLEGTHVFRNNLVDPNAIDPLWELFQQGEGGVLEANNIVGGFVYRGSDLPWLQGKYVFADTGEDDGGNSNQATNIVDIYYGDTTTDGTSTRDDLMRFQIELPDGVDMPDRIWSIAEDEQGELYLLVGPSRMDLFNLTAGETDGGVWRIVPEPTSLALFGPVLLLVTRRRRA